VVGVELWCVYALNKYTRLLKSEVRCHGVPLNMATFKPENNVVFVHGFHNKLGVAVSGASVPGTADAPTVKRHVTACVKDLYPKMSQPPQRIEGDQEASMAAAYPNAVLSPTDASTYRVFMDLDDAVVWVTLQRDASVMCTAGQLNCADWTPSAYIMRAGYENVCLGCSARIPGADVLAAVLRAYVVHQLSIDGNTFQSVKWPIFGSAAVAAKMLNVGTDACAPYITGFLGGTEIASPKAGIDIMRNITRFMPWLFTVGSVVVKGDAQSIEGVAPAKITEYVQSSVGTGVDWNADDEEFRYSLVMMRVKAASATP